MINFDRLIWSSYHIFMTQFKRCQFKNFGTEKYSGWYVTFSTDFGSYKLFNAINQFLELFIFVI